MKKLKSLLIIMLCFCFTTLVACGQQTDDNDNKNTPTTTTITLTEAKEIIVSALAIDELNTVSYISNVSEQVGNRNVYEKLNKFKLTYDDVIESTTISTQLESEIIYNSGSIKKLVSKMTKNTGSSNNTEDGTVTVLPSYMKENLYSTDGINYYVFEEITNTKTKRTVSSGDLFGLYSLSYLKDFQRLFTDETFDSFYDNNVTKTNIENGYTLKLTMTGKQFVMFVSGMTEEQYNSWCQNEAMQTMANSYTSNIVIEFENNEIVGLTFNISSNILLQSTDTEYKKNTVTLTLTKLTNEISTPDWFNENDYV